jgi:hypothetical protein
MALPKLTAAKYSLDVPSTGETIEYRPYLVKEEKLLMLAMESRDRKQMITALRDVILGCTEGKINIEKYTLFDLEYIFIKLRSKSVGENSEVGIKCQECNVQNAVSINMELIEVSGAIETKPQKIQLTESVGVMLRYPTVKGLQKQITKEKQDDESTMAAVVSAIESIYDDENIYPAEGETQKDMLEFVDSLTSEQFRKLTVFFEDMPKLKHDVKFTCKSCSADNEVTLEGLANFF